VQQSERDEKRESEVVIRMSNTDSEFKWITITMMIIKVINWETVDLL